MLELFMHGVIAGAKMAIDMSELLEEMAGLAKFLGFVLVLGMIYSGYEALDDGGWIPHREETTITAQSNWFEGESKNCVSNPLDSRAALTMNKPEGYAISKMLCDGGPERQLKITFYGRLAQPEYTWVGWQCTRNSSSFTCKQTGSSESTQTKIPEQKTLHGKDNRTGRSIISHDGGETWEWADQ
jgi:hypothetical protein